METPSVAVAGVFSNAMTRPMIESFQATRVSVLHTDAAQAAPWGLSGDENFGGYPLVTG